MKALNELFGVTNTCTPTEPINPAYLTYLIYLTPRPWGILQAAEAPYFCHLCRCTAELASTILVLVQQED